jgi:hypothetical protein
MNLLSWSLAIAILMLLAAESVTFFKDTICRQKIWLQSTEMLTRSLLTETGDQELGTNPGCKAALYRKKQDIQWVRNQKKHAFDLQRLDGDL